MTKVLLVDDEPLVLQAYARLLSSPECIVDSAADATSAVAKFTSNAYDVIVSDISMPGMSGLELLKSVRAHDLDMPVVLVTGEPDIETAIEALEYGALRYLRKPVEIAQLRSVVSYAARLHALAKLKSDSLEHTSDDAKLLAEKTALEVRF